MRARVINYLKKHTALLQIFYFLGSIVLKIIGFFVPIKNNRIIFSSFGGRKFDDSPKAIYDEICGLEDFKDWELIWAFVEPDKHEIQRGRKIKIDTPRFFVTLFSSKVWVSNTGMDRGLNVKKKNIIAIETWHGCPIKKISNEANSGSVDKSKSNGKVLDSDTIRCAQSEYDREIFGRIFNATKESILLSDLPRNDRLLRWSEKEKDDIKNKLGIDKSKKVILYMPTYREYLTDTKDACYLAPPMDVKKWRDILGDKYVLLFRAHYAVTSVLNIQWDDFVKDVSSYGNLNDLYIISDMLISDYSSSYVDYSILCRPMLCFAYDKAEYEEKRGLYVDLQEILPCPIDEEEDILLARIKNLDVADSSEKTREFHKKYSPYAGNATQMVIKELKKRLNV